MLPVLIGLGLLIGLPVLYIFRRWHGLVSAERRTANLLAVQARRIPNQPGAMTVSEAVTAKNILMEASELPSLTPRDIPEVSRLWDARHLIDAKACQRTDHHGQVAHSADDAIARLLADSVRNWSESGRGREVAMGAPADEVQIWEREAKLQTEPQAEGAADLRRVSSGASDKRETPWPEEVRQSGVLRYARGTE